MCLSASLSIILEMIQSLLSHASHVVSSIHCDDHVSSRLASFLLSAAECWDLIAWYLCFDLLTSRSLWHFEHRCRGIRVTSQSSPPQALYNKRVVFRSTLLPLDLLPCK